MISTARDHLRPVLELIYPTSCGAGCGRYGDVLCGPCTASFVPLNIDQCCPVCGRPVGRAVVCGGCMNHPPTFTRGFFGYRFEGSFREAVHAFKFAGRKDVGRAIVKSLSSRMAEFVDTFDVIVPMPVTEKRLRERGFNQTFIIGEEMSRITGKPMEYGVLRKARDTLDQFSLSREERRKNIKGAFSCLNKERVKGKRLLLVDDLYTTGSTAGEACKTLLSHKPKEVLFFALARTPE